MTTLHVLGSCAGWPEPDRACAGYVLEHAGWSLVLDLGFGTLPRLRRLLPDPRAVSGVVVSHAHPDHLSDLIGLCRAAALSGLEVTWPLIAPAGVREVVAAGDPEDGAAVVTRTLQESAQPTQVGPFRISTTPTPHYVPNLAVRIEAGSRSVVYTGDTGPTPELTEFARNADLLLAECTDRHQQGGTPDADTDRYLSTGERAGRLAADAGVGHLVLTHFWPGNDRERSRREAGAAYLGTITVADENYEPQITVS